MVKTTKLKLVLLLSLLIALLFVSNGVMAKFGKAQIKKLSNSTGYDVGIEGKLYKVYYKSKIGVGDEIKYCKDNFCVTIHPSAIGYKHGSTHINLFSLPVSKQGFSDPKRPHVFKWQGIFGDISLEYEYLPTELKERLIIPYKLKLPQQFSSKLDGLMLKFDSYLNVPDNLELYLPNGTLITSSIVTDGSIEFRNSQGNTVFYIPRPIVVDNNSNILKAQYEVILVNGHKLNQPKLVLFRVLIPYSELNNAEYPVVIDPTIAFSPNRVESMDFAPLSNDEFVSVYCLINATAPGIYFKVYNTSGAIITSQTLIDALTTTSECNYKSVAVVPINSSAFAVAWYKSGDNDIKFAVYNKNGSTITSAVIVDGYAPDSKAVSITRINQSSIGIAWYDSSDYDITFAVYQLNGSVITSDVDVDTSAGSSSDELHGVDIENIDGTNLLISWKDASSDDASFVIYNKNGSIVMSEYDVDPTIASASSIDSAIVGDYFVIVWSDSFNYVKFSIFYKNGTAYLTDNIIDDVDSENIVSVANIDNQTFVVGWYDESNLLFKYITLDIDGRNNSNLITKPGDDNIYYALSVISEVGGIDLCYDTIVLGWAGYSTPANFSTYFSSGAIWDGVCSAPVYFDPALSDKSINFKDSFVYDVNCTSPGNYTIVYSMSTSATFLSINSSTGIISGTASSEDNIGSWDVIVTCQDNISSTTDTFTLTVVDTRPILSNLLVSPTNYWTIYDLTITANYSSPLSRNEGERLVKWTKNGVDMGYLVSPAVSYWDFDVGHINATTVLDVASASNSNDGTLNGYTLNDGTITGATWTSSGKYGNALKFDGDYDCVSVGDIGIGNSTYTSITLWAKSNNDVANNLQFIFRVKGSPNDYGVFEIRKNSGGDNLLFLVTTENYINKVISGTYDDDTNWHFYAFTFSNGTTCVYVDASLLNCIQVDSTLYDESQTTIGAYSDSCIYSFNGTIDSVRIWNKALTQTEILEEMNSSRPVKPDGLVASWEFESGLGSIAYDTNYLVKGRVNTAMRFDGIDDYVYVSYDDALNISNEITISALVKPNTLDSTFSAIVSKYQGAGTGNYLFRFYLDKLEFAYDSTSGWQQYRTSISTSPNLWHFVAVSFVYGNGSTIKLYVDGQEVLGSWVSGDGNVLPYTDIAPLIIGNTYSATQYFDGAIDSVKIWNRALSDQEILRIYNNEYKIYKSQTSAGDNITVSIKTFDGYLNSTWYQTSFTIVKAVPTLNLYLNGSSNNLTLYWYDMPIPVVGNWSSPGYDGDVTLGLYRDSTLLASGYPASSSEQLQSGTYVYVYNNTAGENWTSASKDLYLNVLKAWNKTDGIVADTTYYYDLNTKGIPVVTTYHGVTALNSTVIVGRDLYIYYNVSVQNTNNGTGLTQTFTNVLTNFTKHVDYGNWNFTSDLIKYYNLTYNQTINYLIYAHNITAHETNFTCTKYDYTTYYMYKCIGLVRVIENVVTPTLPVRYEMSSSSMPDWDIRDTNRTTYYVDSLPEPDGVTFVDGANPIFTVHTNFTASSLHAGTHTFQVNYFILKDIGGSGGSSSGGGGGGGASYTVITPQNVTFKVTPKIVQIYSAPNRTIVHYIKIESESNTNISLVVDITDTYGLVKNFSIDLPTDINGYYILPAFGSVIARFIIEVPDDGNNSEYSVHFSFVGIDGTTETSELQIIVNQRFGAFENLWNLFKKPLVFGGDKFELFNDGAFLVLPFGSKLVIPFAQTIFFIILFFVIRYLLFKFVFEFRYKKYLKVLNYVTLAIVLFIYFVINFRFMDKTIMTLNIFAFISMVAVVIYHIFKLG